MLDSICSKTKWIVVGGAAAALLGTRDIGVATLVVGAIFAANMAKLLKYSLDMARPEGGRLTKSNPGMPSSHAMVLFFFATYLIWTLLHCHRGGWYDDCLICSSLSRSRLLGDPAVALALAMLTGLAAFWGSAWRVVVGLHSAAQSFAGAVCGIVVGIGWAVVAGGDGGLTCRLMPAVRAATRRLGEGEMVDQLRRAIQQHLLTGQPSQCSGTFVEDEEALRHWLFAAAAILVTMFSWMQLRALRKERLQAAAKQAKQA